MFATAGAAFAAAATAFTLRRARTGVRNRVGASRATAGMHAAAAGFSITAWGVYLHGIYPAMTDSAAFVYAGAGFVLCFIACVLHSVCCALVLATTGCSCHSCNRQQLSTDRVRR